MLHDARPDLRDDELTVLRMDYQRLLRDSRLAFEIGDAHEGLRLLDRAAVFERDTVVRPGTATRRDPRADFG